MTAKLNVLGLMLLQEIGFDIVSFWRHGVGTPVKAVFGIFALAIAGALAWKLLSRPDKNSD